jgi:Tol biopolymer transport system component
VPYLRTMLVAITFLLVLVMMFGFPASGQQTTGAQRPAAPQAQQTTTPTPHNGNIAFTSDRDGDLEIFAMSPSGESVTQLTNNTDSDGSPTWMSDGSKITFVRASIMGTGTPKLFSMNSDGSDQVQLPTEITDRDGDFDWSPDGSKIAFVRDLPAGEGQVLEKIFIMNADGTQEKQLRPERTYSEYNPDWSPDGSEIAFVRSGAGGSQIYTVNVDGTSLTQLTRNSDYTTASPDWSPDGSKILFSRFFGTSLAAKYVVTVMNADGTQVKNLTNESNFHDVEAVWSPDGREIAFVRNQNGNCSEGVGGTCDIWRMRADGSSPTKITTDRANDFGPVWLPFDAGASLTGENEDNAGANQAVRADARVAQGNGNRRIIPAHTSRRTLPGTGGAALLAPAIGLLLISGVAARLLVRRR